MGQQVSGVNGDGSVNMTDANLLKFSVLYPETVNFPADTNKDGFIN
ncbi:MAG: dockerin type I domain-containing protein [Oscillospiraceae bacterium]|nr:dockerin type I domain-containing protein [Oscillospiraceae bacterium]